MMRTFVLNHLAAAFLFFFTLPAKTSGFSMPKPTPPNECRVTPPMLQAAIPVEAVTATASADAAYFLRRLFMISRRRTDFPVPIKYQ